MSVLTITIGMAGIGISAATIYFLRRLLLGLYEYGRSDIAPFFPVWKAEYAFKGFIIGMGVMMGAMFFGWLAAIFGNPLLDLVSQVALIAGISGVIYFARAMDAIINNQ